MCSSSAFSRVPVSYTDFLRLFAASDFGASAIAVPIHPSMSVSPTAASSSAARPCPRPGATFEPEAQGAIADEQSLGRGAPKAPPSSPLRSEAVDAVGHPLGPRPPAEDDARRALESASPAGRKFSRPSPCPIHGDSAHEECSACQVYVDAMNRFAAQIGEAQTDGIPKVSRSDLLKVVCDESLMRAEFLATHEQRVVKKLILSKSTNTMAIRKWNETPCRYGATCKKHKRRHCWFLHENCEDDVEVAAGSGLRLRQIKHAFETRIALKQSKADAQELESRPRSQCTSTDQGRVPDAAA